jgi:hypothetical protein
MGTEALERPPAPPGSASRGRRGLDQRSVCASEHDSALQSSTVQDGDSLPIESDQPLVAERAQDFVDALAGRPHEAGQFGLGQAQVDFSALSSIDPVAVRQLQKPVCDAAKDIEEGQAFGVLGGVADTPAEGSDDARGDAREPFQEGQEIIAVQGEYFSLLHGHCPC